MDSCTVKNVGYEILSAEMTFSRQTDDWLKTILILSNKLQYLFNKFWNTPICNNSLQHSSKIWKGRIHGDKIDEAIERREMYEGELENKFEWRQWLMDGSGNCRHPLKGKTKLDRI